MVFITFTSLYSFEYDNQSNFKIPHLDKAVHFVFYFVACVLGIFFLRERTNSQMRLKKAILLMLFLTIAFGICIEILQFTVTADRMGDIFDGLANTIGSICGAIVINSYFSSKKGLKWKF